jgi:hypothetical protein
VAGVTQEAGTGQQRHAVLLGQIARGVLKAEGAHLLRAGADEGDAGCRAVLGETGVLGQEAVAGMDGLGAGGLRRFKNLVGAQVALCRRRGADFHRFVGEPHVQAVTVRLGINGDRLHPHRAQGADDAAGDGATVGDENLVEHVFPCGSSRVQSPRRGVPPRLFIAYWLGASQISTRTGVGL